MCVRAASPSMLPRNRCEIDCEPRHCYRRGRDGIDDSRGPMRGVTVRIAVFVTGAARHAATGWRVRSEYPAQGLGLRGARNRCRPLGRSKGKEGTCPAQDFTRSSFVRFCKRNIMINNPYEIRFVSKSCVSWTKLYLGRMTSGKSQTPIVYLSITIAERRRSHVLPPCGFLTMTPLAGAKLRTWYMDNP